MTTHDSRNTDTGVYAELPEAEPARQHSGATGAGAPFPLLYHSVIQSINDGVVVQDATGVIIMSNASAERILGLSADQMMGRASTDPRWRSVHEDGSPFPGETHPAMRTLRDGVALNHVVMGVHKPDGTLTWIDINTELLNWPEDNTGDAAERFGVVSVFHEITARVLTEQALRAGERKYRQLTESIQEGIMTVDVNGQITFANTHMTTILGYTPEELIGKTLFSFIAPDDVPATMRNLERRRQGFKDEVERIYIHKNGSRVHARLQTGPIMDEEGRFAGAIAGIVDVTERLKTEQALRDSESRYRQLIEAMSEGIIVFDVRGQINFVNQQMADILGESIQSVTGQNFINFVDPSDAMDAPVYTARLRDGTKVKFDMKLTRRDRSVVYTRISATPLYTDIPSAPPLPQQPGTYKGAMAVVVDVTRSRRIEQALEESEKRYRALTDTSTDMIMRFGVHGEITYVSPVCKTMLGYSPFEMLDRSGYEFIHADDVLFVKQSIGEVLVSGTSRITTYRAQRKDGTVLWVESSIIATLEADTGHYTGTQVMTRDISERKHSEEQLQFVRMHDALTGLANRLCFESTLSTAFGQKHFPVSIAVMDVRGMKEINDTQGYAAGDELLRRAARVLATAFSVDAANSTIARIGDNEFAVILGGTAEDVMLQAVGHLKTVLHAHNALQSRLALKLAIGTATSTGAVSRDALLRVAHQRMEQDVKCDM